VISRPCSRSTRAVALTVLIVRGRSVTSSISPSRPLPQSVL
jgi:hypothetical protein